MTSRRPLPNRRMRATVRLEHHGQEYTAGIGYYPSLEIGEVWLDGPKADSDVDFICHDAATIMSIALQYGVDPHAFSKSMARNGDGEPATVIGALADLLAKEAG